MESVRLLIQRTDELHPSSDSTDLASTLMDSEARSYANAIKVKKWVDCPPIFLLFSKFNFQGHIDKNG